MSTIEHDSYTSALLGIQSLLQSLLRISVKDGRVFLGTFAGTDQPMNILLINTEEYRPPFSLSISTGRFIGQVLIPWRMIEKVEIQSCT